MTVDFEKLKKINRVLELDGGHDDSINIVEGAAGAGSGMSEELDEIDRLNIQHLNIIVDFVDRVLDGEMSEEEFLDILDKMDDNLTMNDHLFNSHARRFDELADVVEQWNAQSDRMRQAYQEFSLFAEDEDIEHFRTGFKEIKAALFDRKPLYARFDAVMNKGKKAVTSQATPQVSDTEDEEAGGEAGDVGIDGGEMLADAGDEGEEEYPDDEEYDDREMDEEEGE